MEKNIDLKNISEDYKHEQLNLRKINLIIITGRCYFYDGHYYEKTGERLFKHPDSGLWYPSVDYKEILTQARFGRFKGDFEKKFQNITKPLK